MLGVKIKLCTKGNKSHRDHCSACAYTNNRGISKRRPGMINVDFADVRTVMSEMGHAMMGSGIAKGEDRAEEAAEMAISSPLLEARLKKRAKKPMTSWMKLPRTFLMAW